MPIWITLIIWAIEFAIKHDDEIMEVIRKILELLKIRKSQDRFLRRPAEVAFAQHELGRAEAKALLRRYAQAKSEEGRLAVKTEMEAMVCNLQGVCGLSV